MQPDLADTDRTTIVLPAAVAQEKRALHDGEI
jgi:hypothetical protein